MSYNKEARLGLELSIIENLLSDPDYELSGMDFDYETPVTDLALKTQRELKELKEKVASLENQVKELTLENQVEQLPPLKYKKMEYKYKNEEILCPPTYIPSENEIALAKARYAVEEEIWEIIHYMELYIQSLEGKELEYPYTKELVEKNAKSSIDFWNKALTKWDNGTNIWDCFIDKEWFQKAYIETLSDIHIGDCTAFPASCMRCHAESMFNIPNSAKWKGKGEGYKLYHEYSEDVKKHKEEKK